MSLASKFYNWTRLKLRIHQSNREDRLYFKEREIWWTSLGANIGFEQDGKNRNFERPVLILKKFNRYVLWVLPLTSKDKTGDHYYQFEYRNRRYSIILTQLRLISSKRFLRKIRKFPKDDFQQVKERIKEYLQ